MARVQLLHLHYRLIKKKGKNRKILPIKSRQRIKLNCEVRVPTENQQKKISIIDQLNNDGQIVKNRILYL